MSCAECDAENDGEGATPYNRSLRHFQVENEVLKLWLIVEAKDETDAHRAQPIYRSYLTEKLNIILRGQPISLDASKQTLFDALKDPAHYDELGRR